MYAITTTPGFIIGSRPYGEAGKMLSLFTRDLGLILAAAQGIRFEKSKLRYHTQDYSFGTFSLVRGKEMWRLTSAQESIVIPAKAGIQGLVTGSGSTLDPHFRGDDTNKDLFVRMSALLKRLLQGEDPHPELFDCLESLASTCTTISPERLPELESLTALRILNLLGYIGDSEVIRPFVSSVAVSDDILSDLAVIRPKVNGIINASLQASHL